MTGNEWLLGRHPECHIVVNVGAASRQHAKILREGLDLYLEDLKSRNGTLVNDNVLQARHKLQSGDVIKICDVEFAFQNEQPLSATRTKEPGSGKGTVLFDENDTVGSSTIMSKVDISSGRYPFQLSSSAEVRLQAMVEITHSLGKALGLDEVLPQVLNTLFKIFLQADRGFIVTRNSEGTLVPRWTKTRRASDEDSIRISRTIINKVIDSREAILSADAASDSMFASSESIADFRIRSMMCAPLIDSEGNAFGALQIDTLDQRGRFTPNDLELLVSVASQAAVAIDNAQLHEQALQQKSLQRDLELAHEVQRGFLPDKPPNAPGYEFFQYYQAAVYIGGDYFDYLRLADGRLAIVVADVVGHGVAAALMMAKLSAEFRYCMATEPQPKLAISQLNRRIAGLQLDRFITMVLVVLDTEKHDGLIVTAAHMAPMIRRASGKVDEPGEEEAGTALGMIDDYEYEQVAFSLGAGDRVVLYTDGINESFSEQEEMYGMARLRNLVANCSAGPARLGQTIVDDVRRNMGRHPQDDDMCIVCIGRTPDAGGTAATVPDLEPVKT